MFDPEKILGVEPWGVLGVKKHHFWGSFVIFCPKIDISLHIDVSNGGEFELMYRLS